MFQILIGLKDFARSASLTEACQLFIQEIQRRIRGGDMSEMELYEMCMIEAEYDAVKAIMNFDAIAQFSLAAGILNEHGVLMDKPAPHMPADIEREVFLAANNESMEAYLQENAEKFVRLMEAVFEPVLEPVIVTATR